MSTCEAQMVPSSSSPNRTVRRCLMSVWNWSKQFSQDDITFFSNPLYTASEQIRNLQFSTKSSHSKVKTKKSSGSFLDQDCKSQLLVPNSSVAHLGFWENCYLRWLTPLQIIGGGKPSEYVAQTMMMDDISSLRMAISQLEVSTTKPESISDQLRRNRNTSFAFSDSSSEMHRYLSKHISSSYPFSPAMPTHSLLLPTAISDSSRVSYYDNELYSDETSLGEYDDL